MNTVPSGTKYWVLSCGTGLGVFLLVSFLADNPTLEPTTEVVLWPGAGLATVAGFGSHDMEGFLLYLLGNVVCYCVFFLTLFRLLKIGIKASS
jgi:hypothetical protein